MTIREVAKITGISADTLRYYEQIGVIPQIPRTKGGNRDYRESVLPQIFLIQRLKAAGMSLKGIQRYMRLSREAGDTLPQQRQLLEETRHLLMGQIDSLQSRVAQTESLLEEISA